MNKPSSPAATEGTPGSNRENTPKKSSPSPSPQSFGLGTAGGVPFGGDSARPRVEKTPQSSPRVANSLAKDPDFIKVGCHIGKYIMVAVNTEAEQADILTLCSDLDSASHRINVSYPFPCLRIPFAS